MPPVKLARVCELSENDPIGAVGQLRVSICREESTRPGGRHDLA